VSYVTDRQHAVRVATDGIAALEALTKLWLKEDELACAPGSTGDTPTSGGGTSDPTEATATREQDRYRSRDVIGRKLLKVVGELEDAVRQRQPRRAGGVCSCCDTETATHGEGKDGRPKDCWACWRFRRDNGFHCDAAIHQERPKTNLCACGPECCYACPDKPSEGRTVSERCKKRLQRARRAA
jgi:hypothetical protein